MNLQVLKSEGKYQVLETEGDHRIFGAVAIGGVISTLRSYKMVFPGEVIGVEARGLDKDDRLEMGKELGGDSFNVRYLKG